MNSDKKRQVAVGCALALAAVSGAVLYGTLKRQGASPAEREAGGPPQAARAAQPATNAAASVAQALPPKATGAVSEARGFWERQRLATNGVERTPEQIAVDRMQERLDDEDEAGALKIARQLMKARDKAVRSQVVSALGWVGVKALPELSEMLADDQPDVAAEAFQQWMSALNEIESEPMKKDMLVTGMQTMQELESLEEAVMGFSELPQDLALRGLADVIESGNKLAGSVASEHYEHLTGEKYTGRDDMEQYIKDNPTPVTPAEPAPTPAPAK